MVRIYDRHHFCERFHSFIFWVLSLCKKEYTSRIITIFFRKHYIVLFVICQQNGSEVVFASTGKSKNAHCLTRIKILSGTPSLELQYIVLDETMTTSWWWIAFPWLNKWFNIILLPFMWSRLGCTHKSPPHSIRPREILKRLYESWINYGGITSTKAVF